MKTILPKFKFKDDAIVINAPADLKNEFNELVFFDAFDEITKSKNTLVFVNNEKGFTHFLNKELKQVESDSVLWFAYPKSTSDIKTDINRDTLRELDEEYSITTVTAISINNVWSALRFRPMDRVGKK